jgi:acyl-CoA synthetase (AMP-forming)/AMP-acid ligase II
VPFARDLHSFGDRPAIVTAARTLTYRELAAEVERAGACLGPHRRLLLIAGANELEPLVFYLAALATGQAVLLVPGDNPHVIDSFEAAYDPDVVLRPRGSQWSFEDRRTVSAHRLHEDLALLLSTSGSTGSPKLVRLSHENVQANATAIAEFLDIRGTDRVATTLPLHYCYGLSVVNSHLSSGAALVLTDLSVVDDAFWRLFRDERCTAFAGVPYTFELLDRIGFATMRLPHLRYVTQAGGRLTADTVRRYAEHGRDAGWDLYVMYGQTEATARMAYLPPALAAAYPHTIGRAIPGGTLRLEPVDWCDDEEVGELVYSGPNVMLGYAETPHDLRLGRTVEELRTGDLARRTPEGLYEVAGRLGRSAKLFGLRVDLTRVEELLARQNVTAYCVDGDGELVVAVEAAVGAARVEQLVTRQCGLPASAVRVLRLDHVPRLASGKPDYRAISGLAAAAEAAPPARRSVAPARTAPRVDAQALRALYADLLDRPDVTDDSTFVGLGGDSLSFVEMSVRLEDVLGHLPGDWHTRAIRDLVPSAGRSRKRGGTLDIGVALRAGAIVLIVGSHAHLFMVMGGAHVLIGVAGFNFARFQLSKQRRERARHLTTSILRVVVPTVLWIGCTLLFTDDYGWQNLFLLNGLLSPAWWGPTWNFWFIEALVYTLVSLLVLLSIPLLDRAERRFPFGFVGALLVVAMTTRYDLLGIGGMSRFDAPVVFWLFALGWAAARSVRWTQRLLVSAAALATLPGFFGDARREAVVIAGLWMLVWVSRIRVPRRVARVAGLLAGSSLYVYVTHWQVLPHFRDGYPLVGVLVSFVVGIGYWHAVATVSARGPDAFARAATRGCRWWDDVARRGATQHSLLTDRPEPGM